MKLTRTERWILSNQYHILEALQPDEAEDFAAVREALERGYEIHYGEYSQHIYDENDTLSENECHEVIDILVMHEALKDAYEKLDDTSGIEEWRVKFSGFDGNNETTRLGYTRYFVGMGDRFTGYDINSHCPMLDRYRKMLNAWNQSEKRYELTKEDVVRITSV